MMYFMLGAFLWSVVAVPPLSAVSDRAQGDPNTADPLLEYVRAVQVANLRQFETGNLRVRLKWTRGIRHTDGATGQSSSSGWCDFRWNRTHSFGEFEYTEVRTIDKKEQVAPPRRGRFLREHAQVSAYLPESRLLQIRDSRRPGLPEELVNLRPNESWFMWDRPLRDLLGANPDVPMKHIRRYEAKDLKNGEIQVRLHIASGGYADIVASTAKGGNVIRCTSLPRSGVGCRLNWEWREDSNGRFILVHHEYLQFSDSNEDDPTYSVSMHIESFDCDSPVNDVSFDISALKLVPNTSVQDFVTGKRYKHAPDSPIADVTEELLKGLSEKVRKQGFGARP